MPDIHATTLQALINWLERRDDIPKIRGENYEALAAVADKWDIPMLLHDIDVYYLDIMFTNGRCFFMLRKFLRSSYGFLQIDMIYLTTNLYALDLCPFK
jgi:hypothetical protein